MSSNVRAVVLAAALVSGLSGQTIYNTAAPGFSTTVLAPNGIYDFVGKTDCTSTAVFEATAPGPLPKSLGGCSITVDGEAVGMTFASPGKITFEAPLSGSVVYAGGHSVAISMVTSAPRFLRVFNINGIGIPLLLAANTNAQQGALLAPITYIKRSPGANSITLSVSGAGDMYSYDTPTGPVPPGTISYGWCVTPPVVQLDGVILVYNQATDGSGNQHASCRAAGVFAGLSLQLPGPVTADRQHTLTVTGSDGSADTAIVY
jgi:uncharacterized protein (TIGR03437 family)